MCRILDKAENFECIYWVYLLGYSTDGQADIFWKNMTRPGSCFFILLNLVTVIFSSIMGARNSNFNLFTDWRSSASVENSWMTFPFIIPLLFHDLIW